MSVYLMFNKPAGYLTAARDAQKPTVMEFFPPELRSILHPVGRLDYDTHGLLLMTDDGRVDPALLLPERHAVKKYFFYAIGRPEPQKIARIEAGVRIGESDIVSRPAHFTLLRICTVSEIREYLPEFRKQRYLKNPQGPAFAAELEICEGRKHQVKLMLRAADCKIVWLQRQEISGIRLDPDLAEGQFRPLNAAEREIILNAIRLAGQAERPNAARDRNPPMNVQKGE